MRITKIHLCLLFACMIFMSSEVLGQGASSSWALTKHEAGVQVFTRKIEGSNYKEFKATTVVDADLTTCVAVMHDVSHYNEWMCDTKASKLLKRDRDTRQTYYIFVDAPWPASDRDGIYEMNIKYRPEEKAVYAYVVAKPNQLEEVPNITRMPKGNGYWKFRDMGNGKTEVTMQIHAEPGGTVPAWLANSGVTNNPHTSLSNLKKQVKKSRYANKSFDFIPGK